VVLTGGEYRCTHTAAALATAAASTPLRRRSFAERVQINAMGLLTGNIRTEIDIDASPDAVWAVLADGGRYDAAMVPCLARCVCHCYSANLLLWAVMVGQCCRLQVRGLEPLHHTA
jgi:hypothetical protein